MKSNKEMAEEALRRADEQRTKAADRKRVFVSATAMAACLLAVVGLAFAMPLVTPQASAPSKNGVYTATLLSSGTVGAYVIVAVAAFIMGVAVTLFLQKMRSKHG